MALERSIIKAHVATQSTFEYKARELSVGATEVAKSFVDTDAFRSTDFKISNLIAEQNGITQLQNDANQDKINAEVLERLKTIEEKAYKEGFELGLVEGANKAFEEERPVLKEKLDHIESLLRRIETLKSQILIDNEADLLRLTFRIAEKLALKDLSENRGAVWEVLKDVVGEMQEDERLIVQLSPEDLMFLESLKDKTGQSMESLQRVKMVPNEAIKSGGCMIETEYGTVNATIEERMERMWAALQDRIPKKQQSTD